MKKKSKVIIKAFDEITKLANSKTLEIKEKDIKILHSYVTGNSKPKPTNYRTEQNVIKNLAKLMSAFFLD